MLIESRMHQAIKRNIHRQTMSEDLEWASCIKNEGYEKLMRFEAKQNIQETRSMQSTPERKGEDQRDRSCDRIFGSSQSRRRFKKSSRIGSRKSSRSSNMQKGLQNRGKSRDLLETKSFHHMQNKDTSKQKLYRDSSRDSYDSHGLHGRNSIGAI